MTMLLLELGSTTNGFNEFNVRFVNLMKGMYKMVSCSAFPQNSQMLQFEKAKWARGRMQQTNSYYHLEGSPGGVMFNLQADRDFHGEERKCALARLKNLVALEQEHGSASSMVRLALTNTQRMKPSKFCKTRSIKLNRSTIH
jgi:hypothetical protein